MLACVGTLACASAGCVLAPVVCRVLALFYIVLGRFRAPGGDRLSRTLGCSIIGAGGFHVRVRDGIGWGPAAMATRCPEPARAPAVRRGREPGSGLRCVCCWEMACRALRARLAPRAPGVLGAWRGWLLCRVVCLVEPFGRLGPVSSTRCRAYTPGLST